MTLLGHKGRVLSLDYTPDGNRLISCGSDGTVRVWDLSRNFDHADVTVEFHASIGCMAFTLDNRELIIRQSSHRFFAVDVANRIISKDIRQPVRSTVLDSTGTFVVSIGGGTIAPNVLFSKLASPMAPIDEWTKLDADNNMARVACSAGAKRIAGSTGPNLAVDQPGEIKVWDAETRQVLFDKTEPGLLNSRIALSPKFAPCWR